MLKEIKTGVCDWALPGGGLFAARMANEFGLDCVSLRAGLFGNDYPVTHKKMQEYYLDEQQKYGIEYAALALNDFDNIPMFAGENTREYDIVWDMLSRAVPTAKRLGISMVQVPGFVESHIKTERDMEYAARAIRYLCDEAGEDDIDVAYESSFTAEEFRTLSEMVGRDNFYFYFDSQNLKLNRDLYEAQVLEEAFPYMCNQIHVKDGFDVISSRLLGTGNTDFYATMDKLSELGFGGYILLENYYDTPGMLEVDKDPYKLLRDDIDILKKAVSER